MERLYPKAPEKIPDKKRDIPYPIEVRVKILLAFAWLIMNSSSIRGIKGEKIVLTLKFINQINQKNISNTKALPARDVYLCMSFNLLLTK